MIKELTGGNICYNHPVNYWGLIIAMICLIIFWEIFKATVRKGK